MSYLNSRISCSASWPSLAILAASSLQPSDSSIFTNTRTEIKYLWQIYFVTLCYIQEIVASLPCNAVLHNNTIINTGLVNICGRCMYIYMVMGKAPIYIIRHTQRGTFGSFKRGEDICTIDIIVFGKQNSKLLKGAARKVKVKL